MTDAELVNVKVYNIATSFICKVFTFLSIIYLQNI